MSTTEAKHSFLKVENLFNVSKPKTKQKTRSKSENEATEELKFHINSLSYKKVESDMIILGCVRAVKSLSLEVEMPGWMHGIVLIKSVSNEFTKNLNKALDHESNAEQDLTQLSSIFKVGDFLPVKVVEKCMEDNEVRLVLSTKPSDIYAKITHKFFNVGSLIWASVVEKAEHCYVLSVGMPTCRIILPFNKTEAGTNYVLGQPLWCVVNKSNIAKSAATLTVSTLMEDLNNQEETHQINLNCVLPGTKVDFTTEEITKTGLRGKLFNTCNSCIPHMYFPTSYSDPNRFVEGQRLKAQVLYVEPITNIVYLTLKLTDKAVEKSLSIGAIITATVHCTTFNGVIFKFKNSEIKGLVTHKRLLRTIKSSAANLSEQIGKTFKVNSVHKCRILDYNNMENLYVCTVEQDVLKQKFFTAKDLAIGQTVRGNVHEINEAGIVVKIGNIQGFVPNMHISNVQYSPNIKKKFQVGQFVTMKVLNFKDNQVFLTMKQSLLDSDGCLCNIQDVDLQKQYVGVVVHKTADDVAVSFFNGILGFIKKAEFVENNIEDIDAIYYIGQVVSVYVKKILKNKLILALQLKENRNLTSVNLGQVVHGVVINCVDNESLTMDIVNENVTATLPLAHLNSSFEYSKYLLENYKNGDRIKNLICVSNANDNIIVSLRETNHFFKKSLPRFENLKEGELLRCSYSHFTDDGFVFTSPIRSSFEFRIIVPMIDAVDNMDDLKQLKFAPHQLAIVKVKSVDEKLKEIRGTTKLSEVYSCKYYETLELLDQYFANVEQCKKDLAKRRDPLLNFQEGTLVKGQIDFVGSKGGCILKLENDVKGIVHWTHSKKTAKKGDSVECLVLHVDYMGGYVDLSFQKKYTPKNESESDEASFEIEPNVFGTILLCKESFIKCFATRNGVKSEMVYLPVYLHVNDFVPHTAHFKDKIHDKIKMFILRCIANKKVGLSKQTMTILRQSEMKQKETAFKMKQILHKLIADYPQVPKKRKIAEQHDEIDIHNDETFIQNDETLCNDDSTVDTENELQNEAENCVDELPKSNCKKTDTSKNKKESQLLKSVKIVEIIEGNLKKKMESKPSKLSKEDSNVSEDKSAKNCAESEPPVENVSENTQKTKKKKKAKINDGSQETVPTTSSNEKPEKEEKLSSKQIKAKDKPKETKKQEKLDSVLKNNMETDAPKKKKSKLENSGSDKDKDNVNQKAKKRLNEQTENKVTKKPKISEKKSKESEVESAPLLPGINNFFNENSENEGNTDSSSEDDTVNDVTDKKKKKKKLSAKERAEEIRVEEEKLREKEIRLADSTEMPASPDEFDRLLLAEPNNSLLWTTYIAHFVESTEIDKARATARKALEKINATNEQDKFNIWITLLNLENTYGTNESFEKVFEEAARCCDDLKINLTAIAILAESQKYSEMDKKIKKCRLKFRQIPKMWIEVGKILYKHGRLEDARRVQSDALKCVEQKSSHLYILIQLANFEFSYGDKICAESLYETILLSYPTRADIWQNYTDQLIKRKDFDLARRVFSRAVAQKLPVKKMKTLFKAFLKFEALYGSTEDVAKIKNLAKDFIECQS